MLEWGGGSFDPPAFRAESIVFDDPATGWQTGIVEQG
jgi:hypothetical protein